MSAEILKSDIEWRERIIAQHQRAIREAQERLDAMTPQQPETQRFYWGGKPTDEPPDSLAQLEIGRWWNSPDRANRHVVGIRVIPGNTPVREGHDDQFAVWGGGIDAIIAQLQKWKEYIDADRNK